MTTLDIRTVQGVARLCDPFTVRLHSAEKEAAMLQSLLLKKEKKRGAAELKKEKPKKVEKATKGKKAKK